MCNDIHCSCGTKAVTKCPNADTLIQLNFNHISHFNWNARMLSLIHWRWTNCDHRCRLFEKKIMIHLMCECAPNLSAFLIYGIGINDWIHTINIILMLIGDNHVCLSVFYSFFLLFWSKKRLIHHQSKNRKCNACCSPSWTNKQPSKYIIISNWIKYNNNLWWSFIILGVARINVTIIWLPSNRHLSIR